MNFTVEIPLDGLLVDVDVEVDEQGRFVSGSFEVDDGVVILVEPDDEDPDLAMIVADVNEGTALLSYSRTPIGVAILDAKGGEDAGA